MHALDRNGYHNPIFTLTTLQVTGIVLTFDSRNLDGQYGTLDFIPYELDGPLLHGIGVQSKRDQHHPLSLNLSLSLSLSLSLYR